MAGTRRARLAGVGSLCLAASVCLWAADAPAPHQRRIAANKAAEDGNYKDAYVSLRALALAPPLEVALEVFGQMG